MVFHLPWILAPDPDETSIYSLTWTGLKGISHQYPNVAVYHLEFGSFYRPTLIPVSIPLALISVLCIIWPNHGYDVYCH